MTRNVGPLDRTLRLAFGLVLLALPYVASLALLEREAVYWATVVVGLGLLGTAILRCCPVYTLFGIKT